MSFKNIILFGAGGSNIGPHVLQALVRDGGFNVTVLARASSTTPLPRSVNVVRISDNFPHDDLVRALQKQDVLLVTTGFAAHHIQYKLIDAAVEAGVKRFISSEWGMDNADQKIVDLCPIYKFKSEVAEYLRSKESQRFSWTAVATGIWLDWSLDVAPFLGIDPANHKVDYWRGGTHTPSHTTLSYAAEATLQILKHPEIGKNQRISLSPFQASQREIVAEFEKIQGVKYQEADADDDRIVQDATAKWETEGDVQAAYTLVAAGILLPGHGSEFETAKKTPILESVVSMPRLTLQDVIKAWIEAQDRS